MNSLSAIVLAGGRGTRLKGMTKDKAKSYVSFFGKYRIIDFALSSLSHSNVKQTGIITQYEPYDLMKYIGSGSSWDLDYFNKGISFLTPYEQHGKTDIIAQKGTANACLSQIDYLKRIEEDYVLILSGDQIYKIDFQDTLEFHKKSGAELTVITMDYFGDDLSRYGIIEFDENRRITGFEEKPKNPKSNHISLGMYLFNKDTLLKYLEMADTLTDFGHDLIPYIINHSDKVYSYDYNGYFRDLGTIESMYESNMYLLDNPSQMDNRGQRFKIYSKPLDYPPHLIKSEGSVKSSVVSDGCIVYGKVVHSILSYNVFIHSDALVSDSIILPNAKIGRNSRLRNAIVNEGAIVGDNSILEFDKPTLVE